MYRSLLLLLALLALTACSSDPGTNKADSAGHEAPANVSLENDDQKASYAIGMDIGKNLKEQEMGLDPELMIAGLRDAFAGSPKLSEEEAGQALAAFQQNMMQKQMEAAQKEAAENLTKGQAYLEENKAKEGVSTTESGLQYEVLTQGEGESPSVEDTVTVHYKGELIDGTVFDSSYERGQPATFPLATIIPGWKEALPMMHVGGKWKLYVPAELAYGERSPTPAIPSNSVLVFEVELLEVKKAPETPATAPANAPANAPAEGEAAAQ